MAIIEYGGGYTIFQYIVISHILKTFIFSCVLPMHVKK